MMRFEPDSNSTSLLDRVVEELRDTKVPEFPNPPIDLPEPSERLFAAQRKFLAMPSIARGVLSGRGLAAAASIVVILVLSLSQWNRSTVIAQVQAAIQSAKAVSFDLQTVRDGKVVDTRRVIYVPQGMVRAEGAGSLHVFNAEAEKVMKIDHVSKTAEIRPVYDSQAMQNILAGSIGRLASLEPIEQTKVTKSVRDGKEVLELWVVWDAAVVRVVADRESKLPLRLEVDRGKDAEGTQIQEIIENIRFQDSAPVDLFAIDAPEDYDIDVVERVDPDEATKDYILSDEGLGPIKWEMSFDEVVAAIGKPDSVTMRPGVEPEMKDGLPVIVPGKGFNMVPADPPYDILEMRYDSQGFRVYISSITGVISIRCFDKSMNMRRFPGISAEGIEVGMSKTEVLDKLGIDELPPERFQFRDNRLVSMRASRAASRKQQ